jgi:hypothetical protein
MSISGRAMWILVAVGTLEAQNASNGINSGYVGSDRWFVRMRESSRNQAMLASLSRSGKATSGVPQDYVEVAALLVFPDGNPFPAKRLPDLRILCRNPSADPVERAPWIDENTGFYTILRKGETYDLFWMYYFGGREKFAEISIARNADLFTVWVTSIKRYWVSFA